MLIIEQQSMYSNFGQTPSIPNSRFTDEYIQNVLQNKQVTRPQPSWLDRLFNRLGTLLKPSLPPDRPSIRPTEPMAKEPKPMPPTAPKICPTGWKQSDSKCCKTICKNTLRTSMEKLQEEDMPSSLLKPQII